MKKKPFTWKRRILAFFLSWIFVGIVDYLFEIYIWPSEIERSVSHFVIYSFILSIWVSLVLYIVPKWEEKRKVKKEIKSHFGSGRH